MRLRPVPAALAAALLLLLGACTGGTGVDRDPVASVAVTRPGSGPLEVGSTLQLTATAYDARGRALAGRGVSWRSGNAAVATVDAQGRVAALAAGQATITATSEGASGELQLTVAPAGGQPLRVLAAARGLHIGTAVDALFPAHAQYTGLARDEFDVLVAGNDMKFSYLQPTRGAYRFTRADEMVAFAEANGMRVRGHTLVWHSAYQLPAWLTGGGWTSEQVAEILREHVATVVGRYRGRVYAWDVVNEALDDDGRMRTNSFWYEKLGPGYLEIAFRAAAEADPDAKLFYNDYNIEWRGAKSDSAVALVSRLRAAGVPVHGVGLQSHLTLSFPSRQAIEAEVARFAALGVAVEITELDVRMELPSTPAKLEAQAARYREVVEVCLQSPACDTVVVWGIHDGDSWIPATFPGYGAALLWDEQYRKKPAYFAVQALLAGR